MPPQKRVKRRDRVDLRRMQVQVPGHILDRFRLDVAVLLLSQQQHWDQCRSFSGVDRDQMLELVLRFFREHLAFPLEGPFFPGVNVAGEDNCNKQQHLEESKELQFAVHDGPGEKKNGLRSEEHTSELQSLTNLVCRLLLEKKKTNNIIKHSEMKNRIRIQE